METAHCFWEHGYWFWIVPLIFTILMFACVIRAFRRRGAWRWGPGRRAGWGSFGWCGCGASPGARWSNDTPGRILDERHAGGEISKEQYGRMRRDIESNGSPSAEDRSEP